MQFEKIIIVMSTLGVGLNINQIRNSRAIISLKGKGKRKPME